VLNDGYCWNVVMPSMSELAADRSGDDGAGGGRGGVVHGSDG
jgi:hypothetical protein